MVTQPEIRRPRAESDGAAHRHPGPAGTAREIAGGFGGSASFGGAALLMSAWIGRHSPVPWAISTVAGWIGGGQRGAAHPLPGRSGPINPVANDTESVVPTPPAKAKPQRKVEAPEANAIAIKSRNAEKKAARAASPPNKFREQQQDLPNQVYSSAGQAAVSPMYGMTAGGAWVSATTRRSGPSSDGTSTCCATRWRATGGPAIWTRACARRRKCG